MSSGGTPWNRAASSSTDMFGSWAAPTPVPPGPPMPGPPKSSSEQPIAATPSGVAADSEWAVGMT